MNGGAGYGVNMGDEKDNAKGYEKAARTPLRPAHYSGLHTT